MTFYRILIALILFVAAALKAHHLATGPVFGSGWTDSRSFQMVAVNIELFMGLWLLSGVSSILAWRACGGLFLVFAIVVFGKALTGAASCGCFGRVEVHPWIVFWTDLGVVILVIVKGRSVRFGRRASTRRRTHRYRPWRICHDRGADDVRDASIYDFDG